MWIADLESNGLLDTANVIHCGVFYNTETKEFVEFTPANIRQLPEFISKLDWVSFHNGVAYDLPLLKKVLRYTHQGNVFDTLWASRILFPDRVGKNPHSVESYGEEFGIKKPVHEDWETFTPEMLHRCREDVKIQANIYKTIMRKLEQLSVLDSRITNEKFIQVLQFEQKVCELIEEQARNGWQFDLEKAYKVLPPLDEIVKETEATLVPRLPIRVIQVAENETKAFTKDGRLAANAVKWVGEENIPDLMGDFSKVRFELFNIGSSSQVKEYLLEHGWVPKVYNFKKDKYNKPVRDERGRHIKTSPKLPKIDDEAEWDEIERLTNNENIKLLCKYNKVNHRKHQIEGFIRNLRQDHRIEAQANTCGTNTARMQHKIVVNVPKADPDVFYGKEMRSLFIAAPGKVLVGVDACALEARVEAHYITPFDKAGAYELINGDVHAKNAEVFGVTRQTAKGGKYALTYGCSPTKLATTLQKPGHEAQGLYDAFWDYNIGLKTLKEKLEQAFEARGYILAIDGRPLSIRYKHALINTLFQSAGSIIMKKALVIADEQLKQQRFDYKFVGNFHDEMQIECSPKDAECIGQILCDSITKAGEFYKINVNMEGEYNVGLNWAETH